MTNDIFNTSLKIEDIYHESSLLHVLEGMAIAIEQKLLGDSNGCKRAKMLRRHSGCQETKTSTVAGRESLAINNTCQKNIGGKHYSPENIGHKPYSLEKLTVNISRCKIIDDKQYSLKTSAVNSTGQKKSGVDCNPTWNNKSSSESFQ